LKIDSVRVGEILKKRKRRRDLPPQTLGKILQRLGIDMIDSTSFRLGDKEYD
jgi:hypothetical protein